MSKRSTKRAESMSISRNLFTSVYNACAESDTLEDALSQCPTLDGPSKDQWCLFLMDVWSKFKVVPQA